MSVIIETIGKNSKTRTYQQGCDKIIANDIFW
jgi:hypothetical protein